MCVSPTRFMLAVICFASLAGARAAAETIWNESTDGDLSGNRSAPTAVTLGLGSSDLFATSSGGDIDYLRITVPAGNQLGSLFLRSYSGNDLKAFIGVQTGSVFTEDPNTADPANLLGYTHFGPGSGNVGADVLPQMGSQFGAQGFTPPLPAGDYTFWLQQTGSTSTYQFEFVTVPEPSSLVLAGMALFAGLWALCRRET